MLEDLTPEERRLVRRQQKAVREKEAEDNYTVQSIMATPQGRAWVDDKLAFCGIFRTTFSADPYTTAFNEGQRNVGLALFADIMRACPEAYIQLLKEKNNAGPDPVDRRNADDERNFDSAGRWVGDGDEPE